MCRKCLTRSLPSFRCGTHDHTWSCWAQRRFKLISWLPSASWLSFGCMNVSRRCATDVDSVFTSGPGYDKATTCSEIPLQLLPHYQSAMRRDHDVLSPQACPDTCWRDQLLASTCNNRSPRVRRYPEKWPKLLVNISWINPDEIPPIWPLPLFPALFPPFIHSARYLCISFSWLVSFYSMNMFCFCFFPCSFASPLASLWFRQAETCVRGLHKYCAYTRDNVRAWMWPSCVKFEHERCVYRYVSLSVIMSTSQELLTGDSTQTTALYSTFVGRCFTRMRL